MSWSPTFIKQLESATRRPFYRVSRIQVWEEPGSAYGCESIGNHFRSPSSRIGVQGVKVAGQALNGYDWTTTTGAWSVEVTGDPTALFSAVSRGTILQLEVSFDNSLWERIAVGAVKDIRQQKSQPLWVVECVDFFSAFSSRPTTTPLLLRLFQGIDASGVGITTLSHDAATGDAEYFVASTAGISNALPAGGVGAILINTSGGDPYFRLFTAASSGTITIHDPSTVTVMGTTDIGASTGDRVVLVAYLSGDPMDLTRKILASTGNGWAGTGSVNGAYDVYPENWGLAIPDYLIDHQDIYLFQIALSLEGGGTNWQYAATEPVDDAIGWLSTWLAAAGIFLTMRQGQITIRCAQATLDNRSHRTGITITDADIEEIDEHSAYAYEHDTEYNYGRYYAYGRASDGTVESITTLPAGISRDWDVTDRLWDDGAGSTDDQRASMASRLDECSTKIPERLDLSCAGLRLAQLTPGDLVEITTKRAFSRASKTTFNQRMAMVVTMDPDWDGGRVKVALLIY